MVRPLELAAAAALLVTSSCFVAGCSAAPQEDVDDSNAEVTMSSPKKTAYNYFVSKGLKSWQSAGIVGNLLQESSLNPSAKEYGGGPGRGIAQWSVNGRWKQLLSYANNRGVSAYALTTQLDFIWYELTNESAYGLADLKASTNVTQATIVFQNKYEICGSCAQSTRISYAKQVLADYGTGSSNNGGSSCYSGTLGKSVPQNTCVESKYDGLWYQCDNGGWVDRWSDPDPCSSVHPL